LSPIVIALALAAAICNASWNAVLRSGGDRLQFVTVMSFATTVAALPFVWLLPPPAAASWPYLGVSALLQVMYSFLLAHAYRHGELGQIYPIVRGSVPTLVTLGGFVLAGQRLSDLALCGVALISAAILSLAIHGGRGQHKPLALAILAALCAAAFITTDALGVRLAGKSQSYATWIWLLYGLLMPTGLALIRRRVALDLGRRDVAKALAGGLLSFGSYGAIIAALALGNAGAVSALRETGIAFSVLIGRIFLGESLTLRRVLVCLTVILGALCIGYAG
jgi:drug/metabolite transporter (DMT)-like permease